MSALTNAASSGPSERVATLRSLACIRARCGVVFEAAKSDKLEHFRLHLSKLDEVATFVQGRQALLVGSRASSGLIFRDGVSKSAGRQLDETLCTLHEFSARV